MDEAIRKLKSTTFFGRRLSRRQIADVQRTVRDFPKLSRHELEHTICEHLNLHTPSGGNRVRTAQRLLERLEELGILTLPAKDESKQRGAQKALVWTARSAPRAVIREALARLAPLALRVITVQTDEVAEWNELLDRHHYLGYRRPFGLHLRYAIVDGHGRWLGCLLFAYAARSLPCRDQFIGWDEAARQRRLDQVIGNSRFLIFPWVRVENLASKALSLVVRRLADDWQAQYGYRPVLVETFVDLSRFRGSCYRAANWQFLGETRGKGSVRTPKGVFVHPLDKDFQTLLRTGQRPAARHPTTTQGSANARVEPWRSLLDAVVTVPRLRPAMAAASAFAEHVARGAVPLPPGVFEKPAGVRGDPGRTVGPVPPARCLAAAGVSGVALGDVQRPGQSRREPVSLNAELLRRADETGRGPLWKGHRLFAVDGSKLNLPRPLIKVGYRLPSDNAHYPQGLLSCLYRLRSRVPVDFDLVSHGDERKAAGSHLHALSENDVVVYDRGYFSQALLREHLARGLHPVFRLRVNANGAVAAFADSTETDTVVEIAARPGREEPLMRLRLVKYTVSGSAYLLGTTLLDRDQYRIAELSDLYHERWGIEELYKVSKQMIGIEDFHGQSERGVKMAYFKDDSRQSAGAVRALCPDHTDPAVLESGRRPARGQPGNSRSGADESELQEQPAGGRTTSRGSVPPAGGSARQHPQADRRRDCFVPAKAASEPILRPMFAQAGGKMETPQVGKGHRNEMKEKTRRPAGKPRRPRAASLSEWRFSLSECHCPPPGPSATVDTRNKAAGYRFPQRRRGCGRVPGQPAHHRQRLRRGQAAPRRPV